MAVTGSVNKHSPTTGLGWQQIQTQCLFHTGFAVGPRSGAAAVPPVATGREGGSRNHMTTRLGKVGVVGAVVVNAGVA